MSFALRSNLLQHYECDKYITACHGWIAIRCAINCTHWCHPFSTGMQSYGVGNTFPQFGDQRYVLTHSFTTSYDLAIRNLILGSCYFAAMESKSEKVAKAKRREKRQIQKWLKEHDRIPDRSSKSALIAAWGRWVARLIRGCGSRSPIQR